VVCALYVVALQLEDAGYQGIPLLGGQDIEIAGDDVAGACRLFLGFRLGRLGACQEFLQLRKELVEVRGAVLVNHLIRGGAGVFCIIFNPDLAAPDRGEGLKAFKERQVRNGDLDRFAGHQGLQAAEAEAAAADVQELALLGLLQLPVRIHLLIGELAREGHAHKTPFLLAILWPGGTVFYKHRGSSFPVHRVTHVLTDMVPKS